MSAFPGANAQVYYNEAGEPLGWDYPSEDDYDTSFYDEYDDDLGRDVELEDYIEQWAL